MYATLTICHGLEVSNTHNAFQQFTDQSRHTATGTHVPYGITQRYLPFGRGDIPAFTQPKLGLDLATPQCKAELTQLAS